MSKVLEFSIAKVSVAYVFGQQKEIDIPLSLSEEKPLLFPYEAITLADWSAIRITGELVWDKHYPMLEHNHSPKFWDQLAKTMPDYAERREWLRLNGRALVANFSHL